MEAPPGASMPPPPTVMEVEDPSQQSTKKSKTTKRSFADTVAALPPGIEEAPTIQNITDWAFEDPVLESDSEMDEHESTDGFPCVKISKELRRELCLPWKMALIVKYLGRDINYNVLKQRLPVIWGLQGRMDFIDIGYWFFVARFGPSIDYMHVLLDGPWKIFDNYLVIQRWQPEFDPLTAKLSKMAVWVRIPRLAVEFFREDVIKSVLENVGKPLKLDRTTVGVERGRFARAAVEIDLDKPLVTHVWVRNKLRAVEYEGLHVVCFNCGTVGHREQACPHAIPITPVHGDTVCNEPPEGGKDGDTAQTTATTTTAPTPPARKYGSWMLVTRKSMTQDRNKDARQTSQQTTNRNAWKNSFDMQHANDDEGGDSIPSSGKENVNQSRRGKGKSPALVNANNSNANKSPQVLKPRRVQVMRNDNGLTATGHTADKAPSRRHQRSMTQDNRNMDLTRDPNSSSTTNIRQKPVHQKQGLANLNIVSHSSQAIHAKLSLDQQDCYVTFSYVRPNLLARSRFWEECKAFSASVDKPWLVLGDFNNIASVEEQWGSESINTHNIQRFVDAFNSCGLMDPGATGPRFTWYHSVGIRIIQMRRLDRTFWNINAQVAFPEAKIVNLPRLHSDHNPVMFISEAGIPPERHLRPNRFEAAWLSRVDYGNIWKGAMRDGSRDFEDMISEISTKSMLWNKNEEAHWFQKSKQDWVRDGDRNTRFYHNAALIMRNRNRIKFLKLHGIWTNDTTALSLHITDYFASLFCRNPRTNDNPILPTPEAFRISSTQASYLGRRASREEVKKAVFGMKKYGSPGPDGIPAVFYQHFWDEVGPALTNLVNQALYSGIVPNSLLKAFMTLIPKKEVPETAADFRPITLLNVAFKVISKAIVNRMRPLMCKLIGPHQNSFLPGRSILDNVILTQEIVHTMHRKQGSKGLMVIKVDLHKAYDSVDWSFLERTLAGFNFPRGLIDLIMYSLRESDIFILWNGGRLSSFRPGLGSARATP
ncbi:uncharacterized protein LOC115996040 [Ipomoea triloba]|uniref:uncharacterized protein LOC115996040 n=1 Tax=Ipomoea triloba TaxID=35885 RepID=UPI00125E6B57|nr:uncharacterized protein LOC115996040 [Ipomoea triloba]